nr:MAG TPA: hypothetical protein [Bacteriophage sp.]
MLFLLLLAAKILYEHSFLFSRVFLLFSNFFR